MPKMGQVEYFRVDPVSNRIDGRIPGVGDFLLWGEPGLRWVWWFGKWGCFLPNREVARFEPPILSASREAMPFEPDMFFREQ